MSDPLEALEEAIIDAEARLAAFETQVIARARPGVDIEEALDVIGGMCRSLNALYAERRALLEDHPSLALH